MEVTCQCRAVSFLTPTPTPLQIYHCHCTQCRSQSSSAFGTSAIFPTFSLPLSSQPISVFTRPASGNWTMYCYFCSRCGVRLVHQDFDDEGKARPRCSVKGGAIRGLEWKGAQHIWVGNGVVLGEKGSLDVREGVKCWEGEPEDDDEEGGESGKQA